MEQSIEIAKILELLPHRYPFILVDRIISYAPFEYLTAIKNVTINEPFFQGHFPGNPIMPGVIMIESLAQASALLSSLSRSPKPGYGFLFFFAGVDNVRFKQIIRPGDQLRLEVKFLGQKKDFWRMHAEIFVEDKCACMADLISTSKEVKRD
ncbi:MAG: 3-hydroxyacyl-[acyl-carrier-protein] dehydratase FabZ [Legionellales bacterium RIFCSPHIGHO2_12_FULL_37_14]|nr:MAG: 3-hydroxyacyl-[acyl-carrier-protein] dehydratase FabZ [Legionellales bacterium RIFCSPHIGHO2_12_FULL_37_14]